MPLRKRDIKDTEAWAIYQELKAYALTGQVIPNEHAFYAYVFTGQKGYEMSLGKFRYHFGELIRTGLIEIDDQTRAVRLTEMVILDREDVPRALLPQG